MSYNRRPLEHDSTSSGTPYPTNNFQDLDLELEMLRRKSELIKLKQLELIDQELAATRRMTFDTTYDNYEQDLNYNDKRRADPKWDHEYPPREHKRQRGLSSYSEPSSSCKPRAYSQGPVVTRCSNSPILKTPKYRVMIPILSPPVTPKKKVELEVSPGPTMPRKTIYTEVLRPNKLPSPQVSGRLEFALGVIMNVIRAKYGVHANSVEKIMKRMIRERIKDIMLWKIVGHYLDIVKEYRKKFPERTDKNVLQDAINYKRNKEAVQETAPRIQVPLPQASASKIPLSVEETVKINSETGEDNIAHLLQICSIKQGKWFRTEMKNLITRNLSEMFNKVIDVYLKEHSLVLSTRKTGTSEKSDDNASKTTEIHNEGSAETMEEVQELYNMLNPIVFKRITSSMASGCIPFLTHVVFAAMSVNASDKNKKNEPSEALNENGGTQNYVNDPNFVYYPYFLKVMCKPCLPEKEVMEPFLKQFKPKMVKKHKHIKSLLLVGFTEKDDFEELLACNGCKIGTATITIKISNNIIPKPTNAETSAAPNDKKNYSLSDVISSDLDNQISELLNSIRKAEETENLETNKDTQPGCTEDQDKDIVVINGPDNELGIEEGQDLANKDLNRASDDEVIFVGSNSDIETIDLLETTLE